MERVVSRPGISISISLHLHLYLAPTSPEPPDDDRRHTQSLCPTLTLPSLSPFLSPFSLVFPLAL